MSFYKQIKDKILRYTFGSVVPEGLFELSEYFRKFDSIKFEHSKEGDIFVARSTNFQYGSIITSAPTLEELELKIKDAILSAFSVPSSYAKKAGLQKVENNHGQYAFA